MTYGLERLTMFLQGKRSAFELEWAPGVTWGEVYRESEREGSTYNFELAPVEVLAKRELGTAPDSVFIGPRRLALRFDDLPEQTPDEWIKGPPSELREKAAAGF